MNILLVITMGTRKGSKIIVKVVTGPVKVEIGPVKIGPVKVVKGAKLLFIMCWYQNCHPCCGL